MDSVCNQHAMSAGGSPKRLSPKWVEHVIKKTSGIKIQEQAEIWSIDAHPDGTRVATGGGDACIRIWSVSHIVSDSPIADTPENPRQIAALSIVGASGIKCVRWSPNGQYLAAGDDSGALTVWKMESGTPRLNGVTNYENWVLHFKHRSHQYDLSDLCWSADGSKIATVSFDRSLIITDVGQQRVEQTISDAHKGWILGVSWDPANQLIATQGSDRCVKYWSIPEYKCVAKSRAPFENLKSMTIHFRRLSWMPTGAGVMATCGYSKLDKDHANVVPLLSRKAECMSSIKGHKGAVCCVRFCPTLFEVNGEAKMVLALGSRDYSLSIWTWTRELQHACVFPNVFRESQPSDLAWDPKGRYLYAVGGTGFTAIVFAEQEWSGSTWTKLEVQNIISLASGAEDVPKAPALYSFDAIKRGGMEPSISIPIVRPTEVPGPAGSKKKRIQPTLLGAPTLPPPSALVPSSETEEPAIPEPPPRKIKGTPSLKHKPHEIGLARVRKQLERKKRKAKIELSLAKKRRKIFQPTEEEEEQEHEEDAEQEQDAEQDLEGALPGDDAADEMQIDEEQPEPNEFETAPEQDGNSVQYIMNPLPICEDETFYGEDENGESIEVKIQVSDETGLVELHASKLSITTFRDILTARPVGVSITRAFVAIVTFDNRLLIYTLQGRKMSSPIILDAPVSIVSGYGDRLLLVDVAGQVSLLSCSPTLKLVWRSSLRSVFKTLNCEPAQFTGSLTPAGKVLIDVKTQHVLSYSEDIHSWILLADAESRAFFRAEFNRSAFNVRSLDRVILGAVFPPDDAEELNFDLDSIPLLQKALFYENACMAFHHLEVKDYADLFLRLLESLASADEEDRLLDWAARLKALDSYAGAKQPDIAKAFGKYSKFLQA